MFRRMMDLLDEERRGRLERRVGARVRRLLGREVEAVFFDVSTWTFAAEKEDDLTRPLTTHDAERVCRTVRLTLPRNAAPVPHPEELHPTR